MGINPRFEAVSKRIDGYRKEAIELQTKLTAIPALSPENGGDGEIGKARFLMEYLGRMGFDELKQYDAPDKRVPSGVRPNIVAKLRGKDHGRTIWVMSHMDIVPPGELKLWNTDPYVVKIDGDRLYGRGCEDNQQGLCSSMFAIKALKAEGVVPRYDVGLVIVADEETGSEYGIDYLIARHPGLLSKDDMILVPDAGNPEGTQIEVAEKSILWLKFTTVGKQCHGSMPHKGINSHRAAAFLIVKLNDLYKLYPEKDPVFDPPVSTFEPTKKEANVPNINSIPGDDVFYLDSRVLPAYKIDDVKAKIRSMCDEIEGQFGVKISIETPQYAQAAPATPVDSPVVKALSAAIRDVYKVEPQPIGIGGGTVAAFFRRAGMNAAVWTKMDEVAHQPNEYCYLSNLIGDTKVFAHIFMQE